MWTRRWTYISLLLSTARSFQPTYVHVPFAWGNKSHGRSLPSMIGNNNRSNKDFPLRRHGNENKLAIISLVTLSSTTARSNSSTSPSTAEGNNVLTQDDAVQFAPPLPSQWVLQSQQWLEQTAVLASVLAHIVGESLHPKMWRQHWHHSHKLIAVALVVAQTAAGVTMGGLLPPAMAGQVIVAVILLRCYLLPAVYASLLAVCWTYLCHNGHIGRMLHDVYVLAPWWFNNKLLMTDDAEVRVPALLHSLRADASTVAMAQAFARAREELPYNICDASYLAHHSGALVLYIHAFGPAVTSSPDWSHIVMHCCYGRILDDFQDLEEDARDGNVDRNFFLRLHQHQQHEQHGAAAVTASMSTVDLSHVEHDATTRRLVVQAMQAMHWHEEQMKDPDVQQYARGTTKSLELMMMFKSSAFKRTWQKAAAESSSSSLLSPLLPWPFESLVLVLRTPASAE